MKFATQFPVWFFAGLAAGVYATALTLAGLLGDLPRPSAVALGITLDMVVVVPLAWYFLVVRRSLAPALTLVPVFLLGLILAGRILPSQHHGALNVLEIAAVPIELGVLGWIAWRATRAFGAIRQGAGGDALERFHAAARDLVRSGRAAGILATEIAVFHYAFASRKQEDRFSPGQVNDPGRSKGALPEAESGVAAFTHHERCGHGGTVLGAAFLILFEGVAVHFLVSMWSPVIAWILTLGSAYTLFWLYADFRATVLRPILVDPDQVVMRAGLRWTARVPRGWIEGVVRERPASLGKKDLLSLTLLGTPTHWVVLSRPVAVDGPYGMRRSVRAFGLEPDRPEEFVRSVSA